MQHLLNLNELAKKDEEKKEEQLKEEIQTNIEKELDVSSFTIPEDSVEAEDLNNLRIKFTNIFTFELDKENPNFDLLDRLVKLMNDVRQVYVGLALFTKIKFRITQ